jgi:hypothetical protein
MATYEVEVGGSKYQVEAPDPNTAWEWANYTHQQATAAVEPQKKSTIGSELVRGGKQVISSARTGIESLLGSPEDAAVAGIKRGEEIGKEAGEGVSFEALKKAYEDRGLLSAAGEAVGQIPRALAGQGANLAAMAGGARLGAMAGTAVAPGIGTFVGGALGAGATLLPQFFGSNVERQASEQIEKGEPVQIDRAAAGAAAAGQAAIEGAGTAFVLGKRIVKGVLGVADDAALATTKAQQAMTQAAERSLAAAAGRGVAKGIATEIPVEIAQSVIERAQAGLDVTSPEALSEYGEVAYQAGLIGGAIGGGAGPVNTAMARQGVKAKQEFDAAEAQRLAQLAEAQRAEEEAKVQPLALGASEPFKPVVFPDGSVATTPEDVARYEEQQFQNKYAAQEADKQPTLALGASEPFKPMVFPDGSVATTPEEVAEYERQQFENKYKPQAVPAKPVFVEEPVGKSITGNKPSLEATPAGGDLAGRMRAKREEREASESALGDDYALLQREKQRLMAEEKSPQSKILLDRIDERMGEILKRDIENLRKDKEKAATSVFGDKNLPPVESRDVVVGGEELANLQARPATPEAPLTKKDVTRLEKMREQPTPPESEADAEIAQLEKERSRIKSTNLYGELMGKLAPGEVSDISPDIGRNLRIKGGRGGAFISDMVSSGSLDNYLPPDKRPGSITFDESESAEYIKEKLRNRDNLTFDAGISARDLENKISEKRREAEAPRMAEYEISEVEPGEAASVERSATEQEVGEATDIRYQRSTSAGPSIGVDRTSEVVGATKSKWANAPKVVIAENMDDPVVPKAVREHNKAAIAAGAKGTPKGFFYNGKAYILADAMSSDQDVIETLFHESLGHYGLRGTFGPKMGEVLADVVKNRRAEVEAKAKQYGLDVNSQKDMLEAAEEVLAVMAQTKPGLPFVKRAIAIIRNFLRDLGLNIKLSDADIIEKYILPARAFVESGKRRAVKGKPAASRSDAPKTGPGTAAFKKWFGSSKVVDSNGKPLVMYHGTDADFFAFEPKDGMIFLTADPKFAEEYTTTTIDSLDKSGGQPNILPVYVKAENPFDFDNPEHIAALEQYEKDNRYTERSVSNYVRDIKRGDYEAIESRKVQAAIKAMGHDSFYVREAGRQVKNLGVFSSKQIKSATGNIGAYDPDNTDIRYSRDSITGKPILSQWTTPTDTKLAGDIGKDDLIYTLQDKMIDTKRVVDAISSTAGKIMAKWNPYLQEELYHGRTAKQTKDFLIDELRPLMQAMEKDGVNIADMEEYLKNRHAIAYNAQVAKVNPKMPDGGSGIKTADAQAYLNKLSPADKAKYEALAKRVDSITKGTRKILVDSGLETQETIDNWEATFPFYVPLKRGDIDYAYTANGMGTGQGFDVRGDFSRRAMGSEREATDVLANVAMMRERAIVKAQKNRVAQALFGLAAQNPNPEFWLPVDPLAEVDPANLQELLNFGLTQQDLDFIAKEPRQKAIDKNRNEVVERINATLRNNENVISMRFNGQNRYVFFNPNNERSKRMVESLKNLDAEQLGNVLGPISKLTRWMAAVNTQYNPVFGAYNFLRDVQGAALQLSNTPLAKDTKAVVAGTLPALKGIYAAVRAERDGKKVTGQWSDLWVEFQEQGGQTGFRDQFSRSQERAEALQKELNMIKEGKLKSAGRAAINWLSDYNDSMENAVRLSAYKAALDKGIGKEEAASIAKNLTVNFNRKGQIAVQAGALYAFFNAAMQGTTRLVQTLRGPAGKKIIAGGLLLGSMQAALLAAAGFDDEEPPEFVRERNLILPIGGDKYLAFPMPLGYHVIPSTSRILTEWALSGFKDTPERIASLTGMYLEAFNPIGNAGWSAQTLAPTFADPIVALTENRDWTGKPIARKDFSNLDPTPGYTRAKDTASEFSTQIAKFLNYASGGTEFKPGVLSPTPDQLDYLIGQATGGVGRELLKVEQTVAKTASGEELPSYKIPLVGRFYGETSGSAAESGRFYKNLTLLNEHENEIKGRRENREPIAEYLSENPEARLAEMGRKTYVEIQNLKKRKAKLLEADAPRESIQSVEKMITRKMQMLNDRVRAIQGE